MHFGKGLIKELYLDGSFRIECASNLIPTAGQYLLAHVPASDSPVADPVFLYDSALNGFRAVVSASTGWQPGTEIDLRGPLGRGFTLPVSARKVLFICMESPLTVLRALMKSALQLGAEVVVLTDSQIQDLPEVVEVQPLKSAADVVKWADYIAVDIERANLNRLSQLFGADGQVWAVNDAQVFIRVPMPCGGMGECGVCAVASSGFWKMGCKDGPVFSWSDLKK